MKIYWCLTLRTFREEQIAEQFGYLNIFLYLVILRRNSKKTPCTYYGLLGFIFSTTIQSIFPSHEFERCVVLTIGRYWTSLRSPAPSSHPTPTTLIINPAFATHNTFIKSCTTSSRLETFSAQLSHSRRECWSCVYWKCLWPWWSPPHPPKSKFRTTNRTSRKEEENACDSW